MSRVGKQIIIIPEGIEVRSEPNKIIIKKQNKEIVQEIPQGFQIKISDGNLSILTNRQDRQAKSLHGLYQRLISNKINGLNKDYEISLQVKGIGFKAIAEGENKIILSLGFSHPVEIIAPEGIKFKVEKNIIKISGCDKELVGQVAAKIRQQKPPEPYKGKGIRYQGEIVKQKQGKIAKAAEGVAK